MVDEKATIAEPLTDKEWDDIEAWGNRTLQSYHLSRPKARRIMAEIRELRAESGYHDTRRCDKTTVVLDRVMNVKSIRALLADNARLRESLREYGGHSPECGCSTSPDDVEACSCGLIAVFRSIDGAAEPAEVSK